jgi:hypothetical protein
MEARRLHSHSVGRASGIICAQRVMLNGFHAAKNYPDLRLRPVKNGDSRSFRFDGKHPRPAAFQSAADKLQSG